jgi:threonine/homoserine/homoserine lactone efflux protein
VSSLYLAYLAATIVLVITPGATTAVVVRNTLANGHGAGVRAALGAMAANATHATLAGLGLWVLVGRWPMVLDALRVGGAGYLAWLGLKSLARIWPGAKSHGAPFSVEPAPAKPRAPNIQGSGFVEGLTVNLLNPAIISFYIAVVPTFIPPAPPRFYFAMLAATHVVLGFACHAGWATAFHALRMVFARPGVRLTFELGTAVAMLWLSARVLGRM